MAPDVAVAHATEPPPAQYASSGPSFTQGFILGQLSVVILIFFFIKFFIFGETPSSSDYHLRHHGRSSRAVSFSSSGSRYLTASSKPRTASALRPTHPASTSAILSKTYYNVRNHQPESVDWFNVLIAQTIAQFRNDAQQDNAILTSLTELLNGDRKPDFLDEIRVTELSLGEEFPIFSNCRIIPVEEGPPTSSAGPDGASRSRPTSSGGGGEAKLQARMDVDLSDAITLGIETKILLNYPRPLVAVMPVALAVSVVRFSGTLTTPKLNFSPFITKIRGRQTASTHRHNTSSTSAGSYTSSYSLGAHLNQHQDQQLPLPKPQTTPPTNLTFSFDPSYRLELSTHSLLGSRSRLQDIPKIAQLVESRLHAWFDERCVEPRFQRVVLPSLWPRRDNVGTRGEQTAREQRQDDAAVFDGDGDGSASDHSGREAKTGADGERERARLLREQREDEEARRRETLEAQRARLTAEGLRWRKERRGSRERAVGEEGEAAYEMPGAMPGALPP